jgi:hypothetical protein
MKTGQRNSTGANRGNGDQNENLYYLRSLLFKSGRDGNAGLGLFSDEFVVNCAP